MNPHQFQTHHHRRSSQTQSCSCWGPGIPGKAMWANPNSFIVIYLANWLRPTTSFILASLFRLHSTLQKSSSALSCHKCQHFGHTVAQCSSPFACGCCATPHITTDCHCPETPPCWQCTHIALSCALCHSNHCALYCDCPSCLNPLCYFQELGLHDDEFYHTPTWQNKQYT